MSFMPARQGRFISAAELAEAEAARLAETRAKAAKPPAAPIPENPAEPRARIGAALRQRGKGRALRPNPAHNPRMPLPT